MEIEKERREAEEEKRHQEEAKRSTEAAYVRRLESGLNRRDSLLPQEEENTWQIR